MTSSNMVIIGLLIIIIILLVFILMKRTGGNQSRDEGNHGVPTHPADNKLAASSNALQLANIDEIILQNSLGQELTLRKPSELGAAKYMEVDISGAGNIVQHAGQGAVEVMTLNEISSIAGTELYTSKIPLQELLDNYTYNDGTISSIQFRSADGTGIRSHQGFEVFDSSAISGIQPAIITAAAMQGMAIVSGQYYLKQINKSLKAIGKDIEELKEIHESETRGTLRYCRRRLMEITQMQHCSEADIMEIRDLAGKAGEILEQYRDRYETALRKVESDKFEAFMVDSSLKDYNQAVSKMRYLLQICMVADRIVDEARLAEFVTRRKINVNDPALEDVFNLMDEHYHNGFNAMMNEEAEAFSQRIKDKAKTILKRSYASLSAKELLAPVNKNADDIQSDIIDITGCVRRITEQQNKVEYVGLLLSEDNSKPRFFVEVPEEDEALIS